MTIFCSLTYVIPELTGVISDGYQSATVSINTVGGIAMLEEEIGHVSNYFKNISVAAVEITNGSVSIGDKLHFRGHTTDFEVTVESIQLDHKSVTEAKRSDSIGLKVSAKVRKHDKVYKVIGE